MIIETAHIRYTGSDRLNITRKSGGPEGLPFAPSWDLLGPRIALRKEGVAFTPEDDAEYARRYLEEMRASYKRERPAWDALLQRERVVLVCYCEAGAFCHRRVMAEQILTKLGGIYRGEIRLRMRSEMDKHTCHARECNVPCKPEMLMCAPHWKMVPYALQQEVWKRYRPGQCEDMRVTREWAKAAKAAIDSVGVQRSLFR